ncbi:NMDA receptor-regulated protein 1 [Penicillium taxi]|uniref:NMDA receptor-regulated protein 1 n=1 Tax=Penicillium taxi TaxID=168475 RepID=UPI002544E945|nr:NMDA receptor-regulated protein 1 [Penicillium taxi]KAJ5899053.1 NMDA receptor-regulated protein 1 [Penicillium taxi]
MSEAETETTQLPALTPQFCFDERLLLGSLYFLRLSRSTIDDSITQNLNALLTPSKAGFNSSSTAVRQTDLRARKVIDPESCQTFKDNVLFPSWQSRSDVLTYCAGVATSPDPEDPDLILRETESARDRERVVDERLDPYSARFFPQEARTESLANLVSNQRTVERIVRARTWDLVSERCVVQKRFLNTSPQAHDRKLNVFISTGIKTADQVLRKNPNHGDTQAMKALIMSHLGQLEEAFVLAKEALRNDMKSHICWHVYGLLYRQEKNYEEAIKAYRFALRLEPESQPIQRDLALLQMQMRDFQGYIQSRNTMLQARPSLRQNWTALAIAHHLSGDLQEAEKVLTTFEETLKEKPPLTDMEHSEALLYKNSIIAETGNIERALEHLEKVGYRCTDVLVVMETKADYLLRLGRKPEAEKAYTALLQRNPENSIYYNGLIQAKGISQDDSKALKSLYDEWVEKYPRGDAARRIPLEFLEGDDFKQAADSYLQRLLKKGVPSLFVNLKALYSNPTKRDMVQALVEGYVSGKSSQSSDSAEAKSENEFLSSSYYFLAQHYNYHLSRNLPKALEYVDKAVELSPKAVEYQMTRARIWKHYGNPVKAAEEMEKARLLDEKDRYINTKASKYQLRNNDNEKGLDNMSKFTRNETVGGAMGDLHEMQCVWYLTEDGEAYLRQKKLGLALKRFHGVYNIFETWQEDQFDFHSFSLRKGMIRAYVDMIRWEDRLREHPFYTRVAISAVKAYLLLNDEPDLVHGPISSAVADITDEAERKKALKKAKKEQQRLEKLEADKREARKAAAANAKNVDGEVKKEDPDPLGNTLVQTQDPLKEALKFLTPLLKLSPKNIEVQCLAFEVHLRRDKHLLALKSLSAAFAIDSYNPTLHLQLLRFRKALGALAEPLAPPIAEVVNAEFEKMLPRSEKPEQWNESYLSANKGSVSHVQAALEGRFFLNPESKAQNEKDLLATLDTPNITIDEAVLAISLLSKWGSDKAPYLQKASKKWPESSVFQLN